MRDEDTKERKEWKESRKNEKNKRNDKQALQCALFEALGDCQVWNRKGFAGEEKE